MNLRAAAVNALELFWSGVDMLPAPFDPPWGGVEPEAYAPSGRTRAGP